MDRAEKEDVVTSLHKTFEDSSIVVVTHYSGMTVAELSDLRMQMRDAGASFKVTKNRLTLRALEGTKYQPLDKLFTGPTAIAFASDPVAPAKIAADFAKGNKKLVILGGGVGEDVLDATGVKVLADTPSLDESRAKIAGILTRPAANIASLLQAPGGQVARVLNAYAQKEAA